MKGPCCDKRGDPDNQGRLQEGRIWCEGALGRAINRNGKQTYTVCGFYLFLLFLIPIIGVFLSFLVMAFIPAWLPIIPFHVFPFLCHLLHLFGNHLLRDSAVPPPPPHHFSLSPFFIATCCPFSPLPMPYLSLVSTSFPPVPHIFLFHVVPLPPACSQVSAAVAAEVQDARRRPPAGLPLQASLPCGPLSPPWPSHRAMVPSLASRGPRSTRRYAFSWLLTWLG